MAKREIKRRFHYVQAYLFPSDMGFLLVSLEYPSESNKGRFVRTAGPHSNFVSPVHSFLAASATDDQWRRVLKAIRDNVKDSSFLDDIKSQPRPLRPNDDNYQVRKVPRIPIP